VVVGLIPVILLSRAIARARPAAETPGPHTIKAHAVRPSS
jgi:hypothetical protein